jgi:hypothetical protein
MLAGEFIRQRPEICDGESMTGSDIKEGSFLSGVRTAPLSRRTTEYEEAPSDGEE